MFNSLNKVDRLMLFAAILSLIISEVMWFGGERMGAIFVGLWVPSILGFAIYLKLLKMDRHD